MSAVGSLVKFSVSETQGYRTRTRVRTCRKRQLLITCDTGTKSERPRYCVLRPTKRPAERRRATTKKPYRMQFDVCPISPFVQNMWSTRTAKTSKAQTEWDDSGSFQSTLWERKCISHIFWHIIIVMCNLKQRVQRIQRTHRECTES